MKILKARVEISLRSLKRKRHFPVRRESGLIDVLRGLFLIAINTYAYVEPG